MLRRLVADLADIPGVDIEIAIDAATSTGWPRRVRCHSVASADQIHPIWDEILSASDAIWPIAPETDGILAALTERAEQRQRKVLGCPSGVVRVAGSKLATSRHLARHGIAVVPTHPQHASNDPPPSATGWVVKPDHGAGGDGAFYLAATKDLHRWRRENGDETAVIQPFVPGIPISVSMLAQRGRAWILACNTQVIHRDGKGFSYRGGWVGGAEKMRPALTPIADAIAEALPDLWGYVGVDLIATSEEPVVLEINPRLTSSYLGLRESIGLNPASLVLRLLDEPLSSLIQPIEPRAVKISVGAP